MSINIINIGKQPYDMQMDYIWVVALNEQYFSPACKFNLDLATAKESDIFLTILQQNKTLSVIFTLLSYKVTDIQSAKK